MGFITMLLEMFGLTTIRRARENYSTSYDVGRYTALREVMDEMQRIYGRPSAEWSEHMYGFVSDMLRNDKDNTNQ